MSYFIRSIGDYLERTRRFNNLRFIYSSCDCGYSTNSRCGGPTRRESSIYGCDYSGPDCGYGSPSHNSGMGCGYGDSGC